jgi:hypothetical protein
MPPIPPVTIPNPAEKLIEEPDFERGQAPLFAAGSQQAWQNLSGQLRVFHSLNRARIRTPDWLGGQQCIIPGNKSLNYTAGNCRNTIHHL